MPRNDVEGTSQTLLPIISSLYGIRISTSIGQKMNQQPLSLLNQQKEEKNREIFAI